MRRVPLAAGLAGIALMAVPAPAVAGPSVAESLAIADRLAAQFPQHVNHCSGGRLQITWAVPPVGLGHADGWVWTGGAWTWDHTACRITVSPHIKGAQRCAIIAHELMHFVIGPDHIGPLDPRHPGAVECDKAAAPKRKRTRRQIVMRDRRAMARIHQHSTI